MYDLCATLPQDELLCDSLQNYAQRCSDSGGVPGDWKKQTQQCRELLISQNVTVLVNNTFIIRLKRKNFYGEGQSILQPFCGGVQSYWVVLDEDFSNVSCVQF